jgi:hypothetical protein
MKTCRRLFSANLLGLFVLFGYPAFAQLVPSISNPNPNGVVVTAARCNGSPTSVSGLSCTIKNNASKDVVAYVVLWTLTTESGQTYTNSTVVDGSLVSDSQKLQPGQIEESPSTGFASPPAGDPIVKIGVEIDYVMYADGTAQGANKTRAAQPMKDRLLGAKITRSYLRRIYQQQGLDALLRELDRNQ